MSNRHSCGFYENFPPTTNFDSIEKEKLNLLERLIKIPRSFPLPIQFETINIDPSLSLSSLKEKLVENGGILSGRSVVRREHDRPEEILDEIDILRDQHRERGQQTVRS